MNYKKGISLISLIINVVIIAILASLMIPSGIDKINNAKLTSFNSNIYELKNEVDSYILLNDLEYPVRVDETGNKIIYSISSNPTLVAQSIKKKDENDIFYILDLEKLNIDNKEIGIGKTVDDYFIIAATSRNIYYAKGIKIDNVVHHTKMNSGDGVVAVLPTSVPSYAYNNPIIPPGFTHVDATWDNGFTIQDGNGNQFVWVPVLDPRIGADGTLDGTNFNSKFGRRKFKGEPFGEDTFYETYDIALQNMTASINKYGGFYIAKYEMSNNGSGKAQSKANMQSWANIDLYDSKAKSESMDTDWGWDINFVESYLCYSAHWDTALQWIMASGDKTSSQVITDSTTWGNYNNATFTYGSGSTNKAASSSVKINTGVSTNPANRHMAKGIYDLAGNVWEWTMEKCFIGSGVYRGSSYMDNGNIAAAYRNDDAFSCVAEDLGFRAVLYIK